MRKRRVARARAQLLFDIRQLEMRLGQHFQKVADLGRIAGCRLAGVAVIAEVARASLGSPVLRPPRALVARKMMSSML
jgi:hypothetical protein